MALRITWLAHDATAAVRRAAFPADEPLEDRTRLQTASLKRSLSRFDRVLMAPERRARETAEALGLEGSIDPLLRECDHGRWAGHPLAELQAAEPAALAAWLTDPEAVPHGGESIADLIGRVGHWMEDPARGQGRILAITHPSVLRAALVHALGAPATAFQRIDAPPRARLVLSRQAKIWRLQSLMR
jgi:broad specificity phosphatase PhoE